MDENTLRSWLEAFKAGKLSETDLIDRLKHLPFQDLDFAKIDHHRALRRGFPEVIYGEGKDLQQILKIAQQLKEGGNPVLITRLNEEKITGLLNTYPEAKPNYKARAVIIPRASASGSGTTPTTRLETASGSGIPKGQAITSVGGPSAPTMESRDHTTVRGLVISAGTSDMAVAEEAAFTLEAFSYPHDRLYDVGVAGLHRLMAHREVISKADAIAVVAGMEGALASVVAGLVEVPVIAVPTSVGYGASFGGIAALLGMLTGCSGGVAVVNIDSGFAAGYMLAMILRNVERRLQEKL